MKQHEDTKQQIHIDLLALADNELRVTRWLSDADAEDEDATLWGEDPAAILEHKQSLAGDEDPIN